MQSKSFDLFVNISQFAVVIKYDDRHSMPHSTTLTKAVYMKVKQKKRGGL